MYLIHNKISTDWNLTKTKQVCRPGWNKFQMISHNIFIANSSLGKKKGRGGRRRGNMLQAMCQKTRVLWTFNHLKNWYRQQWTFTYLSKKKPMNIYLHLKFQLTKSTNHKLNHSLLLKDYHSPLKLTRHVSHSEAKKTKRRQEK